MHYSRLDGNINCILYIINYKSKRGKQIIFVNNKIKVVKLLTLLYI